MPSTNELLQQRLLTQKNQESKTSGTSYFPVINKKNTLLGIAGALSFGAGLGMIIGGSKIASFDGTNDDKQKINNWISLYQNTIHNSTTCENNISLYRGPHHSLDLCRAYDRAQYRRYLGIEVLDFCFNLLEDLCNMENKIGAYNSNSIPLIMFGIIFILIPLIVVASYAYEKTHEENQLSTDSFLNYPNQESTNRNRLFALHENPEPIVNDVRITVINDDETTSITSTHAATP